MYTASSQPLYSWSWLFQIPSIFAKVEVMPSGFGFYYPASMNPPEGYKIMGKNPGNLVFTSKQLAKYGIIMYHMFLTHGSIPLHLYTVDNFSCW